METTTLVFDLSYMLIVHLYGVIDENGNENDDVAGKLFIEHGLDEIWDYIPNGIWQKEDKDLAYSFSFPVQGWGDTHCFRKYLRRVSTILIPQFGVNVGNFQVR